MAEKPQTQDGYDRGKTDLILAYCVEIIARLNDLKEDLVIVGGLVPSLLIDNPNPNSDDGHVGTTDIDLGFALQMVNESRYEGVADRLAFHSLFGTEPSSWCASNCPAQGSSKRTYPYAGRRHLSF